MSETFVAQLVTCLATLGLFQATTAIAVEPQAWEMTAADVVNAAKKTAHLADAGDGKQVAELDGALQLETYGLQAHLSEGWWRVVLRLRPDRAAKPDEKLDFTMWNPHGSPGAFCFKSAFEPGEFGPGGKPVSLTRPLRIGPANGNLGMFLNGG